MNNMSASHPAGQAGMKMWPLASALAAAGLMSALLGGCSMMDSNRTASESEVQIRSMPLVAQGTKSPDAYYTLGKYYFYQGRLGQAKAAFLDAIKLDPGHADALNGLGVIYDREGLYDSARKLYEAALLKDPKAAHVWANLGYSLILAGKNAESMAPLQKAIALDPSNTIARQHLAGVIALEAPAVASAPTAQEPAPVPATTVAMAAPASAGPVASVVTATAMVVAEAKPVKVPALQPSVAATVVAPEKSASAIGVRQAESQPSPATTAAEIKPAKVLALQPTVTASVVEPNKITPVMAARQAEPRPGSSAALQARETVSQPQTVIASVIRQQPASNAGAVRQAPAAAGSHDQSWVEPGAPKVAVVVQPSVPEAKTRPESAQTEAKAKHSSKLGSLRIEVSNGNGVTGMAKAVGSGMSQTGLKVARITNARPFNKPRTLIVCRPELKSVAVELAQTMPAKPKIVLQDVAHRRVDVRVVLGADSALAWNAGPSDSYKVAGLGK